MKKKARIITLPEEVNFRLENGEMYTTSWVIADFWEDGKIVGVPQRNDFGGGVIISAVDVNTGTKINNLTVHGYVTR